MSAALERLRGTGVEYAGFLSNHGPMAADALIRLGGAERAGEWIELYRPQLEPAAPPRQAIDATEWARQLGRVDLVGDWVVYFERSIAEAGWRTVVETWLARLLPGAAASATHGLLRTAHAVRNVVEAGDDPSPLLLDELAAGLAFWAARFQRLPGPPALTGDRPLGTAVDALPRLDPAARSREPGLSGRLDLLFGLDDFPAALDAWGPGADELAALDQLIGQSARLLTMHPEHSIALCHAVTAPAAVRMILPAVDPADRRPALAACWQLVGALVAAFISGTDSPAAEDPFDTPNVPQLAEHAVAHGDEHVVKLSEACIRQYRHTGDRQLLRAAEGFRRRTSPLW
jgi:hypothetical protein